MSQFSTPNLRNVTKFNVSYCQIWKHHLKLVLKSSKLFNLVNGIEVLPTMPPPSPSSTIRHLLATRASSKNKWNDKDTNALIIITNCLKLNQVSHITSCLNTKATWDELCQLFEAQDSLTKIYIS